MTNRPPLFATAIFRGLRLLLWGAGLGAGLGGCAVVSVAGAAAGAAISVTGAVVATSVAVTGKVVGKAIDVVLP
jgi:hypothetical protein